MSRTAVRALLIVALGLLVSVAYVRRDRLRALLATPVVAESPKSEIRNPKSEPVNDPPPVPRPAGPLRIGMNLEGVADWSRQWAFVNAFKAAREWQEDGQKPFRYDARGAPLLKPGQRVATYLLRDLGGHYPGGRYVVTWRGTSRRPHRVIRSGRGPRPRSTGSDGSRGRLLLPHDPPIAP